MHRILLLIFMAFLSWHAQAAERSLETDHLIVFDESAGQLNSERFQLLANEAERTMAELLEFWEAKQSVPARQKTHVKLRPPQSGYYGAQFFWESEARGRIRTVVVFGVRRQPHEVAHKLTHALFPNYDKLVRNMMGIPSEARFGSIESFPMCGLDTDDWVLALRDAGAYRPLSELVPEHEPWGHTRGGDGMMRFTNERLHHISYIEAGSFGAYLLRIYGVQAIKRFYWTVSNSKNRAWEEIFGRSFKELENDWLNRLEAERPNRLSGIAEALSRLSGSRMCPSRMGS